jgi:hypothetical protein
MRHIHTKLDTSVENAIRPSQPAAKNWLFVGHPDAGDRVAVIYSLVVSCQRHRHNRHDYPRRAHPFAGHITENELRPLLSAQRRPLASMAS